MKHFRRALCLLLTIALCLGLTSLPSRAEDESPQVRVWLRRLALTDRADLYLAGTYTLEFGSSSLLLTDGSHVVLQVRDGAVCVYVDSLRLATGASAVRLLQCGTGEREGLRFSEGGNLYPGELRLTVSGGQLVPVLKLSVEDYLLGVVPYEMNNTFPLEALKAQAVCARTYALSHVNADAAYDLVDTTDDQVFRGIDYGNTNAVRAVQETAGVVGLYKGQLATCYYSASNGGQTELVEHVWSKEGDFSYYRMVDDPYDLENPESPVKRFRISKDGSGLPEVLSAPILEALAAAAGEQGLDADSVRIDGITAVTLDTPRYEEPSRVYTKLHLTVAWSARAMVAVTAAPTATPSAETSGMAIAEVTEEPTEELVPGDYASGTAVTMDFSLFGGLLEDLNLSIDGTASELVTVEENDSQWILCSRRFGHGVGMSQRGAQQMAGVYGKTFTEILEFYYPGMTLAKTGTQTPARPTVAPALAGTPAPAASPTPRPTLMPVTGELPEGAWLASVEGIEDDSTLNLRDEPNTAGGILMRLYKHQQLIVLPDCEEDGWAHVKTDSVEGYVMVSFLEPVEASEATEAPAAESTPPAETPVG